MYQAIDDSLQSFSAGTFGFGHLLWYGFLLSVLTVSMCCVACLAYCAWSGKLAAAARWISGAQAAAELSEEIAQKLWRMLPSFTPDTSLDSAVSTDQAGAWATAKDPPPIAVEYKLAMIDATMVLPGAVARAIMRDATTIDEALRQTIAWQAEEIRTRSAGSAQ